MGRVKSWMEDLKESAMVDCADCAGDGEVEVQLSANHFRNEDCETCRGTGQVEGEDEYD
jgi:DnaJ-class molecular chaperone